MIITINLSCKLIHSENRYAFNVRALIASANAFSSPELSFAPNDRNF